MYLSDFQLQDFLTTYKNSNLQLVKIMESICDTPLIEFDIYNAFDIKQLRAHIRDMEAIGTEKILCMYKDIITYVVIVYEGFESQITQVSIRSQMLFFIQNQSIIYFIVVGT